MPPPADSQSSSGPQLKPGLLARELLSGYPTAKHLRANPQGIARWQHQQAIQEWSQRLGAVLGLSTLELQLLDLLGKLALPPLLGELPDEDAWRAVGEIYADLPALERDPVQQVLDARRSEARLILRGREIDWETLGGVLHLSGELQLDLLDPFISLDRRKVPLVRVGLDSSPFLQVLGDCEIRSSAREHVEGALDAAGLELAIEDAPSWWREAARSRDHSVALAGHFDTHGAVLTALAEAKLRALGHTTITALSYEWTGSIRRFWKHTIDRLIDREPHWIALHDLTIDSRRPERTFAALDRLNEEHPDARLVWLDHHDDTIRNIGRLSSAQRRIILGPAEALCWAPGATRDERTWHHIAARTDKDISLRSAGELALADRAPDLGTQLEGLLDDRGPSEDDREDDLLPYPAVVAAVRENRFGFLGEKSAKRDTPSPEDFSHRGEGRVIVGNERPPGAGRMWYDLLEATMTGAPDQAELPRALETCEDPYMLWLKRPWAIGYRYLDENTANLLCLTHWLEPGALPVGWYTDHTHGELIGYEQAGWIEVPAGEESQFIETTVRELNRRFSESAPEDFDTSR